MTPREMLAAIRVRAMAMVFASDGNLSYEAAKRLVAKDVAAEQRARKRSVQHSPRTSDVVPVSNARATMLAKLRDIGSRLRATAGLEDTPSPSPQIRKHTQDPEATGIPGGSAAPAASPPERGASAEAPPQAEPEQPTTSPVLIFGTVSNSERIPDSEYAPRFYDHVTDNWRKSIEHNQQIQREKQQRSRFIG
jgi:hypothetical protein